MGINVCFRPQSEHRKIDNLFGPILEDWLYDDVSITAKTEGNQIIFPVASPYRGDESNTIVGTIDNDYVSLLAGELVNNPDGSQGVNLETNYVFISTATRQRYHLTEKWCCCMKCLKTTARA